MGPSALRSAQSYRRQEIGSYEPWELVSKTGAECFRQEGMPAQIQQRGSCLEESIPGRKDNRGKWAPNYEGPFIVKKAFSGGALVLASIDDEELPSPVNVDIIK